MAVRHNTDVQHQMNKQCVCTNKRAILWHSLHCGEVFSNILEP
jgi:hypothetical protein